MVLATITEAAVGLPAALDTRDLWAVRREGRAFASTWLSSIVAEVNAVLPASSSVTRREHSRIRFAAVLENAGGWALRSGDGASPRYPRR